MKKFISLIIIILIFLLNNIIFVVPTAETVPQQAIMGKTVPAPNSLKSTALPGISTKYSGNINIFTAGSNIYITNYTPQTIIIDELQPIKLTPGSSKILVNRSNSLAKGYVPENLINIDSGKVNLEYSGLKLVPVVANALYSLITDAKKDSIKGFIINSAYRTENTQREIFNANLEIFKQTSKTYNEALEKTRKLVALPGNSEHQTGLSIDIFSVNGRHRENFANTKEQLWLAGNLYKYGFIIRYPMDKTKETDSTYEPWHIRYVGVPLSSYLYEKKLCLEEFYDKIFAGDILEDNGYIFMQIKDTQQVYIDKTMISRAELETVKTGTALLSLQYPAISVN